jgi:anti-anti-sigma factor
MTDARGPVRADQGAVPRPFTAVSAQAPAGIAVLVLEGEADMSAAPTFRDALDRGLADGARSLVIDLSEVAFMDSTMLREILRANVTMGELGGVVALAGVRAPVRRLLDLTRTAELFEIADSREGALERAGAR